MNVLLVALISTYSKLLRLYPPNFRDEFGEEMQVMFRDAIEEAVKEGYLALALVCLRELGNLPASLLREFWHEFTRKETNLTANEKTFSEPGNDTIINPWEAWIGTLPFVLFGIASMIGKIRIPFWGIYADLACFALILLGLLIGLVKGVPRWTYSYIGWSLIFAWWWSGMRTEGLKIFGYPMNDWSWQTWIPLLLAIGIALVWTRSLQPLRQVLRGIWQDWTLLSLGIYTFLGFMLVLYDENHSPYLIAFMIVSTLVISVSVWVFMRSIKAGTRIIALLSGFVAGLVIDRISQSTWDFAAYYGLPRGASLSFFDSLMEVILFSVIWGGLLFFPALVGLLRQTFQNE